MNNVVFYLKQGERIVFSQHTSRKLWNDFLEDKSNKIPDIIVAEVEDAFNHLENNLTIENCTECHVVDEENGIEKVCYNLSNEELEWEIKN